MASTTRHAGKKRFRQPPWGTVTQVPWGLRLKPGLLDGHSRWENPCSSEMDADVPDAKKFRPSSWSLRNVDLSFP